MLISQMEGFFKNPFFKRTYALSVENETSMKKRFPVLRQKPFFFANLAEMLTEATIHFFF